MNQVEPHDLRLVTPPCSSFSRAVWASNLGPRPVRCTRYPEGFPWLSEKGRAKAGLGNALVSFAWRVLGRVHRMDQERLCTGFCEHPEDLGRIPQGRTGDVPASIRHGQECEALRKAGWWRAPFRQCDFGANTPLACAAPSPKPSSRPQYFSGSLPEGGRSCFLPRPARPMRPIRQPRRRPVRPGRQQPRRRPVRPSRQPQRRCWSRRRRPWRPWGPRQCPPPCRRSLCHSSIAKVAPSAAARPTRWRRSASSRAGGAGEPRQCPPCRRSLCHSSIAKVAPPTR